MFSKESLYINAIKYSSQLKINYKKLTNDKIVETNSSTFIAKDDILGRDIATKLTNHTEEINNSYISTLLLQEDDVRLVNKNAVKLKDYTTTSLNSDYNIAVSNNSLFETKNYFDKCGVDYVFSAYHILNLHIEQNPCNNNLVMLLFNNQVFCAILNSKGEIIFNKRENLTPFEEIQDSHFFENEVLGQKLFDEVYALELRDFVKNTIDEFYSITKNVFIEKISLLYNLKLISEEEVNEMSQEFMIEMTYHPISVDEELFELSKDTHTHKSFIKPRAKKKSNFGLIVLILVLLAMIIGGSYYFLPINELLNKKQALQIKQNVIEKPIIKKTINLPDHVKKNLNVESKVVKAFEIIPYDMVLNEMHLEKDSLKMSTNLLNKDTFIKVLQPELDKIYKSSNISFKDEKAAILEGDIFAEGSLVKTTSSFKEYTDIYIANEFIPIIRVTEQIKILFPKDTIVTFKSSLKSEVVTFNYLINVIVQNPIEFFEIVTRINNELYSMNISYPVSFIKTEAGIEIEFILQFHQPK